MASGTGVTIDSYPNTQAIRIIGYYYDSLYNCYEFNLSNQTSLTVNSLADRLSFDSEESGDGGTR